MNRTYNAGAVPTFNAAGSSAVIRAEFAAISTGVGALEAEIDAVAASAEWINPAYTETYLSTTQFSWASVDATGVMLKNRRVRCTVNGAYVYSVVVSAVYSGGNTTVTLLDAVLDNPLTLVEYALAIPETDESLGLVLADAAAITDVDDADILAVAVSSVLKKITFATLKTLLATGIYDEKIATQAEAEAGTDNTKLMTPLRTIQSAAVLAGTVIYHAASTPPTGYLKANGAAISRTTYSNLFAVLGTTYGAGDGSTTFTLPDLRGRFIRNLDDGAGIDTGRVLGSTQDDANLSHAHGGSTASDGAHQHGYNLSSSSRLASTGTGAMSTNTSVELTTSAGAHTHVVTINADGGTEARPKNIALLACIKY